MTTTADGSHEPRGKCSYHFSTAATTAECWQCAPGMINPGLIAVELWTPWAAAAGCLLLTLSLMPSRQVTLSLIGNSRSASPPFCGRSSQHSSAPCLPLPNCTPSLCTLPFSADWRPDPAGLLVAGGKCQLVSFCKAAGVAAPAGRQVACWLLLPATGEGARRTLPAALAS